jgi:hypothetical protein
VKDLNQLHTNGKRLLLTGWNNRTVYLDFNQTTMVISVVENGNTVLKVRGIKIGGASGNSEIIPISAGDDTTSRTFTFNRSPKRITWDYVNNSDGWKGIVTLEYGASYTTGLASSAGISGGAAGMMAQATYSADNKSVTLTGHNAFGAVNVSNMTGNMIVEY